MILTSLRLNPKHPDAVRERRDVCRMHARITDATAGMPTTGPRVLWAQPAQGLLVIRAPEPVTSDRLPAGYALDIHHRQWLLPGYGRYRAVMVVNPTRQRSETGADGRRRSIRTPIAGREAQQQWLHELLAPMIQRLQVQVVGERSQHGWHRDRHRVSHRLINVQLTGEVTYPQQLGEIVTRGFGRARAYGGGLSIWSKQ